MQFYFAAEKAENEASLQLALAHNTACHSALLAAGQFKDLCDMTWGSEAKRGDVR
jgi:hypothetical protein